MDSILFCLDSEQASLRIRGETRQGEYVHNSMMSLSLPNPLMHIFLV